MYWLSGSLRPKAISTLVFNILILKYLVDLKHVLAKVDKSHFAVSRKSRLKF